jgi:hypothetical protein
MPEEHKEESIVQKQKQAKPKVEEMISEYLDGESKESILKLLELCKINGIKIPWTGTNRWALKLNKQTIGMIFIGKIPCKPGGEDLKKKVWFTCVYAAEILLRSESVKEEISESDKIDITHVIHRNLAKCASSKKRCAPIKNITILGKDFDESDNLCSRCGGTDYSILFVNPDDKTLYWINKAFELEKMAREAK